MARRGQDPNFIRQLPRRRHLRLVRIERFRMTKTAGLKGVPKNPQNPSHNLRRRLCEDSAEPKPQPAPKTRRRLGGTQERNPSQRLGEDSNICMVSEFISSFLLRTLEQWRAGVKHELIRELPRRRHLRLVRLFWFESA